MHSKALCPWRVHRESFTSQIIVFTSFLAFSACNQQAGKPGRSASTDSVQNSIEITAATIAGNFSSQSALVFDSSLVDSFFVHYPLFKPFDTKIRRFYTNRKFAYAWHDGSGLIEQAGNLYNRMQNLEAEGVTVKVPYLSMVDSLVTSGNVREQLAQPAIDMMLTAYYFFFAERIWGGLDEEKSREIDWLLPRKKVDYEVWLDSLLQVSEAFKQADEPVYRQYNLLKTYLDKYKKIAEGNAWPVLSSKKKSQRMGDSSTLIHAMKVRLQLLGDLETPSETNIFDSAMAEAVKKFQHRFGMKQDGIIGPQVIRELNTSLQKRIEQISVNIERSRWLPDAMKGRYLAVNIPDFKLHAYEDDSLLWSMNVVVGKSVHKTVVFSGELKYVVFSPYWNVPPGILKNEILPGIQKNKNYLDILHMEWHGNTVRQKPGPWNSLGKVKFLFPNSHSIYLHDTPSKSLFNEEKRAFSHGCIRVAEPKKLASYLLRDDPNWDEKKIDVAMNRGKEQYVTLKENMPVFIAYFTAWVDRAGLLNFRDDIYSRDKRLAELVMQK